MRIGRKTLERIVKEIEEEARKQAPVKFTYAVLLEVFSYHKPPKGFVEGDCYGEYYNFDDRNYALDFFFTRSKTIRPHTFGIFIETPFNDLTVDIKVREREAEIWGNIVLEDWPKESPPLQAVKRVLVKNDILFRIDRPNLPRDYE
jgi:hypothetical protein